MVDLGDVQDVNGFVTAVLEKTLKYQKNSPVQSMVSDWVGKLVSCLGSTDGHADEPGASFPQRFPAPPLQ
jgi:hypothetical protein